MQQFSTTPPEGAWNKIAKALDGEENVSHRLYQYEEAPPAAAWQKIAKSLDEAVPANVIPFTTRFRKPIRYAAVACFIAVVLVTVSLTFERTEAGDLNPEKKITVQSNTTSASPSLAEQPRSAKPGSKVATTAAEPGTSEAKAKNNTGPVYSSLNEYVFFSDGDGRLRKVSKKLVDFVNCKDNDLACKQRLKEMHQRMAASAMTTDFTGLVEMLRHLQ